jgi:hypothetical protein
MSVSPLWLVPAGSSILTRGLVLILNKYVVIIVLCFTSLLYSLPW